MSRQEGTQYVPLEGHLAFLLMVSIVGAEVWFTVKAYEFFAGAPQWFYPEPWMENVVWLVVFAGTLCILCSVKIVVDGWRELYG